MLVRLNNPMRQPWPAMILRLSIKAPVACPSTLNSTSSPPSTHSSALARELLEYADSKSHQETTIATMRFFTTMLVTLATGAFAAPGSVPVTLRGRQDDTCIYDCTCISPNTAECCAEAGGTLGDRDVRTTIRSLSHPQYNPSKMCYTYSAPGASFARTCRPISLQTSSHAAGKFSTATFARSRAFVPAFPNRSGHA